jgi:hypothetical protein
METRVCNTCNLAQDLSCFYVKGKLKGDRLRYDSMCKQCIRLMRKKYYENNKEHLLLSQKAYYQNNKKSFAIYIHQYYQDHKDQISQNSKTYYRANKTKIDVRNAQYAKLNRSEYNQHVRNKRLTNPIFKIRENVRSVIRQMIKNNYGSKKRSSISSFLPYTIQQLKDHLQSQFESWMTWDNHGKYCLDTWNDNDPTTWTWQIDHIIPHSDLPYASMEEENFQKAWALDNLRPLNAKQNIVEGTARVRHRGGK